MQKRGSNQVAVRDYNERLVLQTIRMRGALPKAQIARATGLTAQTISAIVSGLESDGLLTRGEAQRGKVGQPSIPFRLNPLGGLSIGLHIGRRSAEMVLADLEGVVVAELQVIYRYPDPEEILAFAKRGLRSFAARKIYKQSRLIGVGVCKPTGLADWQAKLGAPDAVVQSWQDIDHFQVRLDAVLGVSAVYCNDATAACAAELVFGRSATTPNHLYFFVGSFVGGGLVMNGNLRQGATGNAGAVASMPLLGTNAQLVDQASLISLESSLVAQGEEQTILWKSADAWLEHKPLVDQWIQRAAMPLAQSALAAHALLELDAVVIDGAMPGWVRESLIDQVNQAMGQMSKEGLTDLPVLPGTVGARARVMGGAALPVLASFAPHSNALLKRA